MSSIDLFERLYKRVKGDLIHKDTLMRFIKCENIEQIIQIWQQQGLLIKVKGTIFAFAKSVRTNNIIEQACGHLAKNSHISFESALFYHELITNPPNEILAVGPTKKYVTPLGTFRYIGLGGCKYPKGIHKIVSKSGGIFWVASKEKAIADILVRKSVPHFMNEPEIQEFLINKIGINENILKNLNDTELINLRLAYNKSNVRLLSRLYSAKDGARIWAADFPNTFSEKDLEDLFQPYGEVLSIKIPKKFPPMAFIHMKNPLNGKRAIRELDKKNIQGRTITVKETNEELKDKMYIYALISFDKKECYIGQTCDTTRRFKQHLSIGGDSSSHEWISRLNTKPTPIILEEIETGYDSDFKADFLETAWRLVAAENGWGVVNFPHCDEEILEKSLSKAIRLKSPYWPDILEKKDTFNILIGKT